LLAFLTNLASFQLDQRIFPIKGRFTENE